MNHWRINLYKREETSYEGCITFEFISSRNQLIFPFFYSSIYENPNISENETNFFKNYLLNNHGEKEYSRIIITNDIYKGYSS